MLTNFGQDGTPKCFVNFEVLASPTWDNTYDNKIYIRETLNIPRGKLESHGRWAQILRPLYLPNDSSERPLDLYPSDSSIILSRFVDEELSKWLGGWHMLDTPKQKPSFALFLKLPIELRLKIWNMKIPLRRVVTMYIKRFQDDNVSNKYECITPNPTILQACRESRKEGLRFYNERIYETCLKRTLYFNYTTDYLAFRYKQNPSWFAEEVLLVMKPRRKLGEEELQPRQARC